MKWKYQWKCLRQTGQSHFILFLFHSLTSCLCTVTLSSAFGKLLDIWPYNITQLSPQGQRLTAGRKGEQTIFRLLRCRTQSSHCAFIMKLLFSAASCCDLSSCPHTGNARELTRLLAARNFKCMCDFWKANRIPLTQGLRLVESF